MWEWAVRLLCSLFLRLGAARQSVPQMELSDCLGVAIGPLGEEELTPAATRKTSWGTYSLERGQRLYTSASHCGT